MKAEEKKKKKDLVKLDLSLSLSWAGEGIESGSLSEAILMFLLWES